MKFFINLILFFFLSLSGFSAEIKGKIVNLEGNPVSGAQVFILENENSCISGQNGLFILVVPDVKKIKLKILHPDYFEKELTVKQESFSKEILITLIPYIRQTEEVIVTALRYPESSSSLPAAETVLPSEILEEKSSANIEQALMSIPGVSSIGSGGFSKVPSIRGLARRRILLLIDNARVISDRRTGPSASFVNPEDIERIEVLRSPSSVFYGSDAIGGVVQILTKKPQKLERINGKINIKYGFNNQEKKAGISLSRQFNKTGFYLSFQGIDAENYFSPIGEIPMSHFTSLSSLFKIYHGGEKRNVGLNFLLGRGFNIGKPNVDSRINPTWYPQESQNLFNLSWKEEKIAGGKISFQLYFNPNFLETKKEKISSYKEQESFARTESVDYGSQIFYLKNLKSDIRLTFGLDLSGRTGVSARNIETRYDSHGYALKKIEENSIKDGKRRDFGLFLSLDYTGIKNLDLTGGLRRDFFRLRAKSSEFIKTNFVKDKTWTGFIGASYKLFEDFIVFANLSRAYRLPDLSERFYTGITGRGFIIGNPDLKPEVSLNFDAGLKIIKKYLFSGFYVFNYKIDDLVERYRSKEKIYTYGNIESGQIRGFEFEFEYYPFSGWKIFTNFFTYYGKSRITKAYLNDIPPERLFLGTRLWKRKFWFEINSFIQRKKDNPGPAEITIPGFLMFNLQTGYHVNSSFQIYFYGMNIFNKNYLARPDPESREEPGRSISFSLNYIF
ncbi:MAG: TonB-dependent receptor [Acidobacteriota bacterium]